MAALARKIARAKWEGREGVQQGEIPADALGDIRTTENSLSLWRWEGEEGLRDVALALASKLDHVAKIELVWVDEIDIDAAGLERFDSAGDTPIVELQNRHVDVARLDATRLVRIAELLAAAIGREQHQVFTLADVRRLVVSAILTGKVAIDQLSAKMQRELAEHLAAARQQQQQQQQ